MIRPALSVALLLLLSGPGLAEPGRDLLLQGQRHYAYGEYQEAVQLLTRAAAGSSEPKVVAQAFLYLGLSHAVMGDQGAAEQAFVSALQRDPQLRPDPYRIKPDLVALFERIRERQRGVLRVEADRADATIAVDGRPAGRAPLRLSLPIGVHRVEVRAPGGTSERREVVLAPGGEKSITARLAKVEPVTPRASAPGRRRLWTWMAAGGGAACAVAAGALWASVRSDLDRYHDPATPDERARELEDPIRRKVLATNVMIGLGSAFGAAAVVLFFLEGRNPPWIQPALGVESQSLWLSARGRF
jgi:tetratricopeptide (TPR) repeat protein